MLILCLFKGGFVPLDPLNQDVNEGLFLRDVAGGGLSVGKVTVSFSWKVV